MMESKITGIKIMVILKYKKEVYLNELAITHGWTSDIEEICVQEWGLFVNKDHVFILNQEDTKNRLQDVKNLLEISVSDTDAKKFKSLCTSEKMREKRHDEIKLLYLTAEIY